VTADAVVYDDAGADPYDDVATARRADGTTWVRVVDPDAAELESIRDGFDIHPLETEDVQNNVRPKVDVFDDHVFVLLKEAELARGETTFAEELAEDPVGIFVGQGLVVTMSLDRVQAVERAWTAVDKGDTRVVARGADFTAYRIIDGIVDDYFGLLDETEDDIERVEDEVIDAPDARTLDRIHSLRRELLSLRRLVWPARDAVGVLARGDPDQVSEEAEKYYRDVYDHLVQLVDLVETYRDLTSGARDIYLNSLSMSTNEVMKKLTVVATIVLPLTFIAGVYGMNFAGYFRQEGWL